MKINGRDIREFGARQHRVVIGHQSVKFSNEWLPGDVLPWMGRCTRGFKSVTVTLVVKGRSRSAILKKRSELLGLLMEPVVLDLDKNTHHFCAVLKSHKETEVSMQRWHNMELEFECYEYGDDVTVEGDSSLSVDNPGTAVSSCRVVITPGISSSEITLTGISMDPNTGADMPVKIPDVVKDKVIILDGIDGLITEDGALKLVDMWAYPAMKPGTTEVTCDNRLMDIEITVRPMFV